MLTTAVPKAFPPCDSMEEFFNLGRTTIIPRLSSLHSSAGVEGGVRDGVSTRANAKPSSMVLVLDLDECLVHSRLGKAGEGVSNHSFVFETDGAHPQSIHVTLRPHLQQFLSEVTSRYETCVFTAGKFEYASPLLDILDPTGTMFSHRFFPKDLTYHKGLKCHVKDLRSAFSQKGIAFDPRRVVLVDNLSTNFALNPSNGIPIADFVGDQNDSALHVLVQQLRRLEEFHDVRPVLDDAFHMNEKFIQYKVLNEEEEEDVECSVEEETEEEDHDEFLEIKFDHLGDVIMEDVMDEEVDDGEDAGVVLEEEEEAVVVEEDDDLDSLLGLEYISIGDEDLEDVSDLDFWIDFQYPWEVEEELSLDRDSESVEVEEQVEQVEQVLRRSPRLRNVPRVDYRKYF